jgi:hypothetical protein
LIADKECLSGLGVWQGLRAHRDKVAWCVIQQGCTHPSNLVDQATKFSMVEPNVCGPSVGNFFRVTLLAPRILRWLLDVWKFVDPCRTGSRTCWVPVNAVINPRVKNKQGIPTLPKEVSPVLWNYFLKRGWYACETVYPTNWVGLDNRGVGFHSQ